MVCGLHGRRGVVVPQHVPVEQDLGGEVVVIHHRNMVV